MKNAGTFSNNGDATRDESISKCRRHRQTSAFTAGNPTKLRISIECIPNPALLIC
ncbi:hypothetical protein PO909_023485 [Leuciscus waleckii]